MAREKMAELNVKLPARWVNFLDEFYSVSGMNRDKNLREWMMAVIGANVEELDAKDRILLIEKYQLTDICEIPQWIRDEAAGISRNADPIPKITTAKELPINDTTLDILAIGAAKVAWHLVNEMSPEELEHFKSLTKEELDERLKAPLTPI
ncbi:hypothetical protein [Methanoregula formicica]|uniref:Uncharacterized protein n=1 Tax=Methanoregula formicica (strain DSM 22288 / NBRC 105244 / SMSP) TaxID=593750 RepID=L0HE67_METFS|nr:hypothetical protein [Methanoregula formicica]AGB03027.1 hypothetical protein Metfor_2013 [Methanoregula formicica SMSP]